MNDKNKIPYCPPLRFPEFKDEWKKTTLGEVAEIKKGVGMSKEQLSNQGNPVILYGELYTTYKSEVINTVYSFTEVDKKDLFITKGGEVIIPSSGETAWDIATARCVIPAGVILGGDLNIIILKKDSGVFLSYLLNGAKRLDIANVAQGSSVVHLYGKELQKLIISLPPTSEQQKIANFLSLIDERIQCVSETIKELKRQKAGLLNQIFSQKLRFPEFYKDWGKSKLEYILEEVSEKNIGDKSNRVISSTIKGLFYQDEFFNKTVASKDIENYKVLRKKQLVLSPQNIWMGNINVNMDFDKGVVSPSYKIFSFKEELIKPEFAMYILKTPIMLQMYKDSSSQGASIVRRNLEMDSFYSIKILIPSLAEQSKIANLFSLIDERIKVEELLLQEYTKQKSYLLSKMFV